ncbi:uncharacterized protein LOC100278573 precursor [Zea mays]|uniref:Uncharacterized protein n=1 Tax=Zea mays TaxID=4577 RepID=B6UAV1_MAIZE|nr:uncharacterized protein LOC100278573 precursor [Zea mays]ACG46484.1 hypothetical protein [Zea mays]
MDSRYITLCIFLVLVLHGDTTLAETCKQFPKWSPLCFSAICKASCFIEGKFSDGYYVKGHRCCSTGYEYVCNCLLCKN